jgi:hypothetical protein
VSVRVPDGHEIYGTVLRRLDTNTLCLAVSDGLCIAECTAVTLDEVLRISVEVDERAERLRRTAEAFIREIRETKAAVRKEAIGRAVRS